MADHAAELGPGGAGQLPRRGALVLGLVEADLHQLVVPERRVEGPGHRRAHPASAYLDQGAQAVGVGLNGV